MREFDQIWNEFDGTKGDAATVQAERMARRRAEEARQREAEEASREKGETAGDTPPA